MSTTIPTDSQLARAMRVLPWPGPRGPWVAGGAVRRAVLGTEAERVGGDIDYFFRDADQFESWKTLMLEIKGATSVAKDHLVAYSVPFEGGYIEVQAINARWFFDVIELFNDFDFTMCQFAMVSPISAVWTPNAYTHAANKHLVCTNLETPHQIPLAMIRRAWKYQHEGFTISAEEIRKILRYAKQFPKSIEMDPLGKYAEQANSTSAVV